MKRPLNVAWFILSLLLLCSPRDGTAQQVERWTTAGGGVEGWSNEYLLAGTVGQSITGIIVQTERSVEQGFWHAAVKSTAGNDRSSTSADVRTGNLSLVCLPNPVAETARITATVPIGEPVVLRLYDDLGRIVKTLMEKSAETERLQLSLDCSRLSEGAYTLRLTTSTAQGTVRFVVVR